MVALRRVWLIKFWMQNSMRYNIIIGIVLLVLSLLIGWEFAKKYTKRRIFFNDFNSFNQIISAEISFSKSTIPEVIRTNSYQGSDFYFGLRNRYIDKLEELKDIPFLTERENNFYKEYVLNIGKGGSKTCGEYVNGIKQKIAENLSIATKEEEKNKPLCIKIAFLIGLVALISLL